MQFDEHDPCGERYEAAFFRALMGVVDGFVACIDAERRILFLNRTLSRDRSEVMGKPIETFITPEHRQTVMDCVARALESDEVGELEYTVLLADGTELPFVTRVFPFRGPLGERLAVLRT